MQPRVSKLTGWRPARIHHNSVCRTICQIPEAPSMCRLQFHFSPISFPTCPADTSRPFLLTAVQCYHQCWLIQCMLNQPTVGWCSGRRLCVDSIWPQTLLYDLDWEAVWGQIGVTSRKLYPSKGMNISTGCTHPMQPAPVSQRKQFRGHRLLAWSSLVEYENISSFAIMKA